MDIVGGMCVRCMNKIDKRERVATTAYTSYIFIFLLRVNEYQSFVVVGAGWPMFYVSGIV